MNKLHPNVYFMKYEFEGELEKVLREREIA